MASVLCTPTCLKPKSKRNTHIQPLNIFTRGCWGGKTEVVGNVGDKRTHFPERRSVIRETFLINQLWIALTVCSVLCSPNRSSSFYVACWSVKRLLICIPNSYNNITFVEFASKILGES